MEGKGAADLGLRGKVEDNPLLAVLAGYEPSAQKVVTEGQAMNAGQQFVIAQATPITCQPF